MFLKITSLHFSLVLNEIFNFNFAKNVIGESIGLMTVMRKQFPCRPENARLAHAPKQNTTPDKMRKWTTNVGSTASRTQRGLNYICS